MDLKFTDTISQDEFDLFVSTHESGSFLQSPGWGKWMEQQGRKTKLIGVTDKTGNLILAAQIFLTPIPRLNGHYIYIPYGPIVSEENPEAVNLFLDEIKKRFSSAWFLRIEPKQFLFAEDRPTKHIQPGKTLVLDLAKTEDELLAEMHHKTRYNIRVAERHGVAVEIGSVKNAVELIQETSQRQGFRDHPSSYYENLTKFFGEDSTLKVKTYVAKFEGQILASAIIVDYGDSRTYLFGGTSNENRNVMAPYLMHWQAIKDARVAGYKVYDFWGIETASGETPGFVRFKLGWGGKQISYPHPTDIVYKSLWYNAYKLLRSLSRKLS